MGGYIKQNISWASQINSDAALSSKKQLNLFYHPAKQPKKHIMAPYRLSDVINVCGGRYLTPSTCGWASASA